MQDYTKLSARYWHIICYDIDVVNEICATATRYAYIYHDRDLYTEDSENHKKGDLKPPHYHVYVYRKNDTKGKFFVNLGKRTKPDNGNVRVAYQDGAKEAVDYMCHADERSVEAGKTPYDPAEVVYDSKGRDDHFLSQAERAERTQQRTKEAKECKKAEREDDNATFISDLITHARKPYTLAKKYGRDYIINRRTYHTFCDELMSDPSLPLDELTEEARAIVIEYRREDDPFEYIVPSLRLGQLLIQQKSLEARLDRLNRETELHLGDLAKIEATLKRQLDANSRAIAFELTEIFEGKVPANLNVTKLLAYQKECIALAKQDAFYDITTI